MQVAIDGYFNCKIVVPYSGQSADKHLDDAHCVCARPQSRNQVNAQQLENTEILRRLETVFNEVAIEDWRYRTNVNTLTTLDDTKTMAPAYVKINHTFIDILKDSYITTRDLTNLKLESTQTRPLKAKDVFKTIMSGLTKTLLTHPNMAQSLHKQIKDKMQGKPGVTIRNTREMINQEYTDNFQRMFDVQVYRPQHNMLAIVKNRDHFQQFQDLARFNTKENHKVGLRQVRKSLAEQDYYKNRIIPAMIDHLTLANEDITNLDIAYEEQSIVQLQYYQSYVQIKIWLPIYLKEITTIYQVAPLPFQVDSATNVYVEKMLPPSFGRQPGSKTLQGPQTPCALALAQQNDITYECFNQDRRYKEITRLMILGNHDIYMIQKIHMLSITCPYTGNQWVDMNYMINVIVLHASCHAVTVGSNYQLQIEPRSDDRPTGKGAKILFQYNITDSAWIPSNYIRWILIIVLVIITTIILTLIIIAIAYMKRIKIWYSRIRSVKKITEDPEGLIPIISNIKTSFQNSPLFQKREEEPAYNVQLHHRPEASYKSFQSATQYDPTTLDLIEPAVKINVPTTEHWLNATQTIQRKPKWTIDNSAPQDKRMRHQPTLSAVYERQEDEGYHADMDIPEDNREVFHNRTTTGNMPCTPL